MRYVPLPIAKINITQPLPVDVWAPNGALLLRRGQAITSQDHLETLKAHSAAITSGDADAWQNSYERLLRQMVQQGASREALAQALMPGDILAADFEVSRQVQGDWLDLQDMLLGLLYQGEIANTPLPRLAGIERRALELLQADPEEGLFVLFQALADLTLGYSATHSLLTAVVCELTTQKLGMTADTRRVLFSSALTMNIGMARDQNILARQNGAPNEHQRKLIKDHPPKSHEILQGFGVNDVDQLDIVHWHHDQDESNGLARNLGSRRILRMADSFVAKMAPRKTRLAMSPLGAVKALLSNAAQDHAKFASAMATAVGFYPPGTYVQLVSDEKAVIIARGPRANQPHAATLVNAAGIPLSKYIYRDTSDPQWAIRASINADHLKVKVSPEKIARLRATHVS